MGRARLTVALLVAALTVQTVRASVIGQLYCDVCQSGVYDVLEDFHIPNANVVVTCTIAGIPFTTNSATTASDGTFTANFPVEIAVVTAINALSSLNLISCQMVVTNTPKGCSVPALVNGVCAAASVNLPTFNGMGVLNTGTVVNVLSSNNGLTKTIALGSTTSGANSVCFTGTSKSSVCTTGGSSNGDPHFTGGDGSHYDFSGEPNSTFCLLSDDHLHINAYYGGWWGQWGENPHKALTWIRALGLMWGKHTIELVAREGARWQYDNGYMAKIAVDDQEIKLTHPGDFAALGGGLIEIRWVAAKEKSGDDEIDVYQLKLGNILTLRLKLRPELPFLRTAEDGLVHFNLELPRVDISDNAHGVMGQTYRPDFVGKLEKQHRVWSTLFQTEVIPGDNAEGFLEGDASDYKASGLLKPDCRFARFSGALLRLSEVPEVQETGLVGASSSFATSRKMLTAR